MKSRKAIKGVARFRAGDQFNGLLEIIPDTIEVLSSGNALVNPRSLSVVTENDEGSYLFADELAIDSISGISASGYNLYTTHTSGSKILIRVDADANIPYQPEDFNVGGWVYVYGIGTQFDASFPFTSGYQILATILQDIVDGIVTISQDAVRMDPNPATSLVQLSSELTLEKVEVFALDGQLLLTERPQHISTQLNISTLQAGLYVVKAFTNEGIWTSTLSVIR